MDELLELFAASRADIDSVPYAHETECNQLVGDLLKEASHGRA